MKMDNETKQPLKKKRKQLPSYGNIISSSSSSFPVNVDVSTLTTEERCNYIAELSESVLQNPDISFFSQKRKGEENNNTVAAAVENDDSQQQQQTENSRKLPSKVKTLIDLADIRKVPKDVKFRDQADQNTARLAMVSLLAIFQDVLPAYRIRLPTAQELAVRVSKDTKKLWDYERALLTHYQWYLKVLEFTWETESKKLNNKVKSLNSNNNNKKKSFSNNNNDNNSYNYSPLGITAILSLCELLKSCPYFNFRSTILSIVARQTNNRICEKVAFQCCDTLKSVFEQDSQGEVSLEATKIVTKVVQTNSFHVYPQVVDIFLSLPLRVHQDEAEAAKIAKKAQNKKRKKGDGQSGIEDELKESSGTIDKIALAQNQADTLHAVILCYFRILKTNPKDNKHVQNILPSALRGLAKFSHLIHFDTVLDLLKVLKTLLENVDALPLEAALNAVLAAFQTLQGPGKELQIDQKEYINPLYSQLPRLCSNTSDNEHFQKNFPTALQCLLYAFLKRREYSTVRIASFFKQILTICLHTPTHISIPLLAFARQISQRYSTSITQLLENEADVITSGSYTPELKDPEHCNPFATSAWELGLLKFHINPEIGSKHAKGCAENKLLQFPAESPTNLFEEQVRTLNEGYIPCRVQWKKHPFHVAMQKQKQQKNNKKGNNSNACCRFVTARKSTGLHLLKFNDL